MSNTADRQDCVRQNKNLHMKIPHSKFQQFLTLFLCLILIKSTIIFAAPEDVDKLVNTSSDQIEEPKKPFEARKTQEKLTSEAGEKVKEKVDIKEEEKPDVIEKVINKAVV